MINQFACQQATGYRWALLFSTLLVILATALGSAGCSAMKRGQAGQEMNMEANGADVGSWEFSTNGVPISIDAGQLTPNADWVGKVVVTSFPPHTPQSPNGNGGGDPEEDTVRAVFAVLSENNESGTNVGPTASPHFKVMFPANGDKNWIALPRSANYTQRYVIKIRTVQHNGTWPEEQHYYLITTITDEAFEPTKVIDVGGSERRYSRIIAEFVFEAGDSENMD